MNRNTNIGVISIGVLVSFLAYNILFFNTVSAAVASDTATVNLSVGTTISITSPSDVTMGAITGTGQSALTTNSATWNVKTNNSAGYSLAWQASAATMASGADTIAAYTPAVADTAEVWSVGASASEWGGHLGSASTTVNTTTWGAADTYGGGKWLNVKNTAAFTIATRSTETSASGDDEIVYFGAEVGSTATQPTGTYTVDVTMTATTL